MGAGRGSGVRFSYYNVADGHLRCGEEIYDWYAGLITGVRTKEASYNGKATVKLEIRMMDHETMDANNQAVISGTLVNNDGTVSTWGRMIVQRLVNPDNDLDKAEPLVISVYAAGETRGSCAALRRLSDPTALKGVDFHKEDPRRCREITEAAIDYLIEKYGTFGKDVPEHQAPEEEMAVSAHVPHVAVDRPATRPAATNGTAAYDNVPPPTEPPPGYQPARASTLAGGDDPWARGKSIKAPSARSGPDESQWRGSDDDSLPF